MKSIHTFKNLGKTLLPVTLGLLAACTNLFEPEPLSDNYNPLDPEHYSPPQIILADLPADGITTNLRQLPLSFEGDWADLTQYRWQTGISGHLTAWTEWRDGGTFTDTANRYQGILDTLFLDETYGTENFTIKIQAKYSNEFTASDSLTRIFTVDALQSPTAVLRPQTVYTTGGAFELDLCFDSMTDWTAADLVVNFDSTAIEFTAVDTLSNGAGLSVYDIQAGSVTLSLGNYGNAQPVVVKLSGQAEDSSGVYDITLTGTRFLDGPTSSDVFSAGTTTSRVVVLPESDD
ncbi:MAG: hypothetical protein K9N34_09585 [Candidatus Marinimicrobia bacterium]|nr:hypothetical protein [Candidatus Neomarinimicrobiota bacterium]MCF7840555.1 hypothetical protein [Candidatus Neomarinimicrobiota bacterium]